VLIYTTGQLVLKFDWLSFIPIVQIESITALGCFTHSVFRAFQFMYTVSLTIEV